MLALISDKNDDKSGFLCHLGKAVTKNNLMLDYEQVAGSRLYSIVFTSFSFYLIHSQAESEQRSNHLHTFTFNRLRAHVHVHSRVRTSTITLMSARAVIALDVVERAAARASNVGSWTQRKWR